MRSKNRVLFLSAVLFLVFLSTAHAKVINHRAGTHYAKPVKNMAQTADIKLLIDRAYYSSLIRDMKKAKKSIMIIMYLFKPSSYKSTLPNYIINTLIKKDKQGINVSVLMNIDRRSNPNARIDTLNKSNLLAAKRMEKGGIKVYFDSPYRTTHAKVVIIDRRIVYIGSHNFTQSAFKYNHEVSVRIVSPAFAKRLINYFGILKHER